MPTTDLAILEIDRLFKPCQVVVGVAVKLPNRGLESQVMIVARDEQELAKAVSWFKQNGKFNRLDMQHVAILPFEAVDDPDAL